MPPHNNNKNSIGRSEYFSISENAALKDTVLPFLNSLKSAKGYEEYAQQLTYNYQNNLDRKSTRLNSSHLDLSRMPSSA